MRPSYWGNEADEWEHCIPRDTPVARAAAVAHLLSSQFAYFQRLDDASTEPLKERLGGDWLHVLLRGLGYAFAKHQIHDLVAVHPTTTPLYLLPKLVRLDPNDPAAKPTGDTRLDLSFRMEAESVVMDTNPLPTIVTKLASGLDEIMHAPILEFLFDEAITHCMHAALAQALEVREPTVHRTMGQTLADIVDLEQQRGSSRSGLLANVAVCSHGRAAALRSCERMRVLPQPHFPGDRLLLLYKGSSALLGSIAWVPHVFQFLVPEKTGQPRLVGQGPVNMSIRHKVVVTNPESICVAELKD